MNKFVLKFFVLFIFSGFLLSCSNQTASSHEAAEKMVTVISWNVQTFFDGEKDNCEYEEFKKTSLWNREKYQNRLKKLCSVIEQLNADIYIFQEIENEKILYDISNQLAGKSWNSKNNWNYSCFSKPEGTAIGCAVLSKYELSNLTTHQLDIRSLKSEQPAMRYILQVAAETDNKSLTIFVNHWKSKSGGEEKTEIWRDWQESLLSRLLNEYSESTDNPQVVLCGDFNRDINDFVHKKNNVYLRNAGCGTTSTVTVNSPWYNSTGGYTTETGSYYYQNQWERIDHIFVYGNIKVLSFSPCCQEPFAFQDKTPYAYHISSDSGYSDHLPVKAVIKL